MSFLTLTEYCFPQIFSNVTIFVISCQWFQAVDELFKLMALFATKYPDSTEHEIMEINNFRRQTLQLYLNVSFTICSSIHHCLEKWLDHIKINYGHFVLKS